MRALQAAIDSMRIDSEFLCGAFRRLSEALAISADGQQDISEQLRRYGDLISSEHFALSS